MVVASVEWFAYDGVCAGADAGVASIVLRTCVSVFACCAVGEVGVAAHACCGITCPCDVALIQGFANDQVCARASAGFADIGLRATVFVVAHLAVWGIGVATQTCCHVAHADFVAGIEGGAYDGVHAGACSGLARIGLGAGIAVVASCSCEHRTCAVCWRAGGHGAGVTDACITRLIATNAVDAEPACAFDC